MNPTIYRLLKALYPPGVYADGETIHDHLVQTDAEALSQGQNWLNKLERDIWPDTAEGTLAEWESLFGISPDAKATMAQRQAVVAARFRSALSSSPEHIRMMVSDMLNSKTAFHDRHDDNNISFRWEKRVEENLREKGDTIYFETCGEGMPSIWDENMKTPDLCLLPIVDRTDDVTFEAYLTELSSTALKGGICFFQDERNAICFECVQKSSGNYALNIWLVQNGTFFLRDTNVIGYAPPFCLRLSRKNNAYYYSFELSQGASSDFFIASMDSLTIKPRYMGLWAALNPDASEMKGSIHFSETKAFYGKPWNNIELIEIPQTIVPKHEPEKKFFAFVHREPKDSKNYDLKQCQRLLDRVKQGHTLMLVGESDCFRCDDNYSLCDRDILGS